MSLGSTQDRLSNLSDSLIENILKGLPIRDVARTSVLSTKWRYKWTSVPHFLFNDECIPGLDGLPAHDKLVQIVNLVLLTHTHPILSFKFSSSHLQTCSEIDNWVCSLSLSSLIDFELQIAETSHRDRFHNCLPNLFSFKHLSSLRLISCIIPVPPSSFKGFSCLKTLFLKHVTLSDAALKCLVSSCPELENLTLIHFDGATHVEVTNPKLKHLHIHGKDIDVCLNDLKLLVYASFAAWPRRQTCSFNNIFPSLLGVQVLYFQNYFLKSLALNGNLPKRLPSTLYHLKAISFSIDGNHPHEILLVLCLLNGSPSLRKLEIQFLGTIRSDIHDLHEINDQWKNTAFNTLRVVKFFRFCGCKVQLLLIKLLLATSQVLERMKIYFFRMNSDKELTFWKKFLQFKRASPKVEIMYHYPPDEV